MADNEIKTEAVTFKKRARSGNLRVKPQEALPVEPTDEPEAASHDGNEEEVNIIRKERKVAESPFIQGTASSKLVDTAVVLDTSFQSNRNAAQSGTGDQGATATLEVDTSTDRDSEARLQRQLAITKELGAKGVVDDGVYRGQSGYTLFVKKQDAEHGAKYRPGPQRASANIRTTIRFDYQPDVCKDYKETGFCGFGDSCKFLHDRGDYKAGWQLDRDWEIEKNSKKDDSKYEIKEHKDDALPFACIICRQDFTNPVVTRCGHYFCEKCALENHKKSPKCFVCSSTTNGIFNTAKDLLRKIKEKKERIAAEEETQETLLEIETKEN